MLAAAERTGALLVSLENLYGYGPTGGRPMTEDLPLAATGVKGRTRAAMTAELLAAADDRAAGQVWHLPGPATGTTRALLDLVAAEVGHPVAVRSLPKLAVRGLGLVNPMLRELAETYYQFDEPFVLDTSKYQAAFGAAGTPLADAIAATLAWYKTRPGTP